MHSQWVYRTADDGEGDGVIEHVVRRLRLIEEGRRRAAVIQIGERQARELADDLNATWAFKPSAFRPITWEEIMMGRKGSLLGVRLEGVESPDYFNVVDEALPA
jgi:hypothetical protein